MLLASTRYLLRLVPTSKGDAWQRTILLGVESGSRCRLYTTTPQKIVRVNARRSPTGRASSTMPPEATPPRPPPPPPPGDRPTPPASWGYVAGAVAAAGVAAGAYYFINLEESDVKAPESIEAKKPDVKRVPASITDLPESIEYLLIGGGTASFAAFRAIKSNQPKAQVLVISEEDSLPYMRPPLSKELWRNTELPDLDQLSFQQWNGNRRSLYYESGAFYADVKELPSLENGGVSVARGYTATSIDPVAHEVTVSAPGQDPRVIKYGKCLIATGVRPRNISVLESSSAEVRSHCVLLRTVRDAARLWRRLEGARDVLVVGGGLLGSELACAVAARGEEGGPRVTQVFREGGNLAHLLPEYLAAWCSRQLSKLGVRVLPHSEIKRAYMSGDRVTVELDNGEKLETDVMVVGAGSEPNTSLAEGSGLEVHPQLGGLLVNAELQARTDLYAAGDVACFYDPKLGRRRVEHHDHAVVSGRLAGENMAGACRPYRHQSMFWSDLGPALGLEAIGIVDANLPTVAVFAEAERAQQSEQVASAGAEAGADAGSAAPAEEADRRYERGVIFYLEGRRVVGVLMWNLFNRMAVARQLLAQNEEYEDLNEVAKLFRLHE